MQKVDHRPTQLERKLSQLNFFQHSGLASSQNRRKPAPPVQSSTERTPDEPTHRRLVIAADAAKDPAEACFQWALKNILRPGDHVIFLGILQHVDTPMGYRSQADSTNQKTLEAEVWKKMDHFEEKLLPISAWCDREKVYFDITIAAGSPLKVAVVQETNKAKATHVILDRSLRRDIKYYRDRLDCFLVSFTANNCPVQLRDSNDPMLERTREKLKAEATPASSNLDSPATTTTIDSDSVASWSSFSETSVSTDCHRTTSKELEISLSDVTETVAFNAGYHSYATPQQNLDTSVEANVSVPIRSPDTDSGGSSGSPSRESSYIDLCMLYSPDGITPVWCSGGFMKNEMLSAQASSSYCEASESKPTLSSTRMISSPDSGLIPEKAKKVAAMPSNPPATLCFPDKKLSVPPQNVNLISVQPARQLQELNELLKVDETLWASDDYDKEGKLGEIHYSQSLDSDKALSSEIRETELLHKTASEIVVHDYHTQKGVFRQQDIQEIHFPSLKLSSITEEMDGLLGKTLSQPPPLCSVCKLKSPELGKSPKKFMYEEIKIATGDFSNLIAEGGFGYVYRGTLQGGEVVAVKKLKASSVQIDVQFGAEVEALSCAQHRNLVRLIGYCTESNERALVYEYVCNGSLDRHISGQNGILNLASRHKIALGAARGLRYLHEECRVGCIVHRDMQPNNILLTHDFTAMVGDFGLAKLSSNGDVAVETKVIGSLGYVAPEYVECGQVTSKTDVYAFGVVLLELITGRKAVDLSRPKGELSLTEWARLKLANNEIHELVDQKIPDSDMFELHRMVKAASLCIERNPFNRPGMSQILRILEGDFDDVRCLSPKEPAYQEEGQVNGGHQSMDKLQTVTKKGSTVRGMLSWARST